MTEFDKLTAAVSGGGKPYFAYSRDNEERTAKLFLQTGILVQAIGYVQFSTAKISADRIANWAIAKALTQRHPHSPNVIPDLDIDHNINLVNQQAVFLSLLTEFMNDPENIVDPVSTKFALKKTIGNYTKLYCVAVISKQDIDKVKEANSKVPVFEILRNDGTGNLIKFAEMACLPEYSERLEKALMNALYSFEASLNYISAKRGDPSQDQKLNGPENA